MLASSTKNLQKPKHAMAEASMAKRGPHNGMIEAEGINTHPILGCL
jgi:hypothetical protein